MKWYPEILEDLRKECMCDRNVSLEDAIYNHFVGEKND